MKRTIAVFTLEGALGVTPALLAAPETKKTEAPETKKVEAQETKKAETQADLQKEAKISMDKATEIALERKRKIGARSEAAASPKRSASMTRSGDAGRAAMNRSIILMQRSS